MLNGTPCVPLVIRYNLNYGRPAKASQRFGGWIGFTLLGGIQGQANITPHLARESAQVSSTGTDPYERALRSGHYTKICLFVYAVKMRITGDLPELLSFFSLPG